MSQGTTGSLSAISKSQGAELIHQDGALMQALGQAFFEVQALEHVLACLYGASPHGLGDTWSRELRRMLYTVESGGVEKTVEELIFDLELPQDHWLQLQQALYLREWVISGFFSEFGSRLQVLETDVGEKLVERMRAASEEISKAVMDLQELVFQREMDCDEPMSEQVQRAARFYWVGAE
ncbi:hypothetical protein O5O45_02960 [Hahella aquimaris]|uniref:hypothetical protein n=1 Tax=Hahella sp. HNIBRBA332 TaxID=3015983 RepID=UPI00273B7534|nr:hypothetical protein [Hahella sp. HNIBRBA332]WLQ14896.1 hypothetical protein O5O45_02960 [Hahella sp. HNIBRBA332]